jgi:TonB family protein
VSRDEFKTQVLLLHKDQSALDHLSSGFNDSYTVHCATSGSEALNTLVETPINVIISAQDLPGMSGLEALREAKKRSPETIGILLAGTSDDGLETLVGDKEVFQVVRGDVTSDSLLKLVDTATQQLRLMALAESANDTDADVDEPSAQHIVMETSENGATIISDGTGQMQALHAAQGSALGSRSVDLLALTRDPDFFSTVKASSRGMHTVHYATTLAQAVETIREHKVGVAVVDAAMVGDRVEQLTQHLRQVSPRLVSIVAGRREDGEMLMDLINRGKVYRFLLKPVSPGRARLAVEASIKHHLEAPDAAFTAKNRIVPSPPATPALKATPQTVPEPEPEPEPTAERKVEPVPDPQPEPDQDSSVNVAPSPGSFSDLPDASSIDNKLADSFNGDDSGSTGTVSELVSAVAEDLGTVEDLDESMEVAGLPESASSAAAAKSGRWSGLGLGGVAIIVAGAVVFWFVNSTDVAVTGDESPVDEPAATEAELILGAPARDTDRVDGDARVVVDAPVEEALIAVETALLESRLEDANAALQRVSSADPDNARLPFLAAQLSQMQLLESLNNARTAIRESRFEDAGAATRSVQQAEDVLAMANARLDAGDLLKPPNDNARYYFDLALSIDPRNAAARQGLSVIASKLSLRARSETENGDLDSAEVLLSEAYVLDPENSELAAAVDALSNKRDAIAAERRQEEEQRRAAEKRAAAERKAAEERAAAERKAAEERAAAQAAAVAPAKEAAELPAEETAAAKGVDATSGDAATTGEGAGTGETATTDEGTTTVADEKPSQESETTKAQNTTSGVTPGSVSALNRIKYVAPKYPRAAQRRNLSGWVDVVFTVTTDGTVKDIAIPKSEPGDTFVNAATKAVEKWLFEPVVENGAIVEKRVGVRMMFALE